MGKSNKIDLNRLLGFSAIGGKASDGIDFRNQTIGARVGAKVSVEVTEPEQTGQAD